MEVTDIALADLKDVDRQRLEDPVIRSSRAEIDAYIDQLRLSKSWVSSNDEPESGAQSASRSGADAQSGETKAQ